MFNISYPVKFFASGGPQTTDTPVFPRLRAMFDFAPGTRLMNPNYGVDLQPIEQATHNSNDILTVTLINARESITRYLRDYVVASLAAEVGSTRRELKVSMVILPVNTLAVQTVVLDFPQVPTQ